MTTSTSASPSYQLFMLALCVFTLASLFVSTVVPRDSETSQILAHADFVVCLIFLTDFVISLSKAEHKLRYLYTWGWLDLLSSIPMLDAARWGRAARIVRALRVLRGIRAARALAGVALEQRSQNAALAAALLALLLLVVASVSILQVETGPASNITTAEDAIWWALSTITTVGYGDRFPVTPEGRVIAGILMCAGVGLFGMFSGFLAAWFVSPESREERHEIQALREEIRELRTLLETSTISKSSSVS